MSSVTSTNTLEFSTNHEDDDNSNLTLNSNNNKLIIENHSNDITISKFDNSLQFPMVSSANSSTIPLKTQVLPLVYIQNHAKLPFASVKTTNANNLMVNNISQLQFTTVGSNSHPVSKNTITVTSAPLPTNQNVIFASGNTQPLVIQKPLGNIVQGSKITSAYLTMLKPVPKPVDNLVNVNKINLSTTRIQENMIVTKNGFLQSANPPQKIVLAPMPKITSNRPSITATTNTVQPKIALLPMPVPKTEPPVAKQKIYNFQITDGKLRCENSTTVTVLCDDKKWEKENNSNENSVDVDSDSEKKLVCDTTFEMETPEKNDISNKTYELSITEESLSNQSDMRLIVSSVDSNLNGDQKQNNKQKEPLKFSHGVSILKKNFSNLSDKKEKSNSIIISKPKTLISDPEVSVTTKPVENGTVTAPSVVQVTASKPERERRRKSHFACRKDFDEMDISFPSVPKTEPDKKPLVSNNNELKDPLDLKEIEDFDPQKFLKWDDGIGTLPGSNLKFIVNEFNIIEYVTEDDYKKIIEKRLENAREKMKTELQEEIRCLECGCYGLRPDFINPKYCSFDCQETYNVKLRKEKEREARKKKRKPGKPKSESVEMKQEIKQENESNSEEDNNSNDPHQENKYTYPWACKKKGFSWSKYLEHMKAKPAPVKLFKDPFPYTRNGFRPGMKLEGVDPYHPAYFCVLSVSEIMGYRVRLHFDGYPENYDFWCNADSMDIFPVGWCEKYGHVLQPPPEYTIDNFSWVQYLKQTKSSAAPKHLFTNRAGQAICPNGFRVGMKLEAVDRKNTSLVCVASVRDMMDNRLLIHFDSWNDIYDYWVDPTSPYIHPVGWCDQYGHNLTPPNDYPSPETFSWETYLKETKSVAAPVRAFKQRPVCGFKRGMKLECVDKRVPQLIRVATVDDVKEHQIRIKFDGWPDRYSYWVDDDSPDIHPMGWCQKTGHAIEPPLTPEDVYDFLECPTVGCRGQGHIKGPKYSTHSIQKYCPYAEENIDIGKVSPDRLTSPDRRPEAVVPVSREPKECKIKPKLGRPPKYLKELIKSERTDEPAEKKPRKTYTKKKKRDDDGNVEETAEQKARSFIQCSNVLPAEKESWERHSRFLQDFIDSDDDPQNWSNNDVIEFVASIPGCDRESNIFKKENIDGTAFLMLNQKDILSILNFKVGPAVKLYNSIVLLRQQFVDEKSFS